MQQGVRPRGRCRQSAAVRSNLQKLMHPGPLPWGKTSDLLVLVPDLEDLGFIMCRSESTFSFKMRKKKPTLLLVPHYLEINNKYTTQSLWVLWTSLPPSGSEQYILAKIYWIWISRGPEAGTRGGERQPVPAEGTVAKACGCEAAGSDSSNAFVVTGSRVCEKSES